MLIEAAALDSLLGHCVARCEEYLWRAMSVSVFRYASCSIPLSFLYIDLSDVLIGLLAGWPVATKSHCVAQRGIEDSQFEVKGVHTAVVILCVK